MFADSLQLQFGVRNTSAGVWVQDLQLNRARWDMGGRADRLLYKRSEFATGLGLAPQTITRAINEDRLFVDPETDCIDPSHPSNLGYIQRIVTKGVGTGLTPEFKKALQDDFLDMEKRKRKKKFAGISPNSKVAQNFKEISSRLEEDVSTDTREGEDLFDKLMAQGLLQPGEQLKIANTTLANLRIAKEMDDLIVKEMVVRFFSRLNGIMTSRLLCLGQRSAKAVCSIFGDMSGDKAIAVQQKIDDEVASAVEAIQREIADASDW